MATGRKQTRKWIFGCTGTLVIIALALCGFLNWFGREGERRATGYVASVAGVPATHEDIDAFIERTFLPGMTREEVLAIVESQFIHQRRPRTKYESKGRIHYKEQVAFPGLGCDEDNWCPGVEYDFYYVDDRLERVKPVVS